MIEEDRLVIEFVADTLAYGLNREVLCLTSEQEAREYLDQTQIAQVLIVGVDGQGMDGFGLIDAIRQSFPGKTCIAMSAKAEHEQTAARMCADGFLAKPFGMMDLFELARHFMIDTDAPAQGEAAD